MISKIRKDLSEKRKIEDSSIEEQNFEENLEKKLIPVNHSDNFIIETRKKREQNQEMNDKTIVLHPPGISFLNKLIDSNFFPKLDKKKSTLDNVYYLHKLNNTIAPIGKIIKDNGIKIEELFTIFNEWIKDIGKLKTIKEVIDKDVKKYLLIEIKKTIGISPLPEDGIVYIIEGEEDEEDEIREYNGENYYFKNKDGEIEYADINENVRQFLDRLIDGKDYYYVVQHINYGSGGNESFSMKDLKGYFGNLGNKLGMRIDPKLILNLKSSITKDSKAETVFWIRNILILKPEMDYDSYDQFNKPSEYPTSIGDDDLIIRQVAPISAINKFQFSPKIESVKSVNTNVSSPSVQYTMPNRQKLLASVDHSSIAGQLDRYRKPGKNLDSLISKLEFPDDIKETVLISSEFNPNNVKEVKNKSLLYSSAEINELKLRNEMPSVAEINAMTRTEINKLIDKLKINAGSPSDKSKLSKDKKTIIDFLYGKQ